MATPSRASRSRASKKRHLVNYRPADVISFPLLPERPSASRLLLEGLASSTRTIAFKIQTNNAERYTVRPSMGLIPPDAAAPIELTLSTTQVTKILGMRDTNTGELLPCKDKFQVLTAVVDPDDMQRARQGSDALAKLWRDVWPKRKVRKLFTTRMFEHAEVSDDSGSEGEGGAAGDADGVAGEGGEEPAVTRGPPGVASPSPMKLLPQLSIGEGPMAIPSLGAGNRLQQNRSLQSARSQSVMSVGSVDSMRSGGTSYGSMMAQQAEAAELADEAAFADGGCGAIAKEGLPMAPGFAWVVGDTLGKGISGRVVSGLRLDCGELIAVKIVKPTSKLQARLLEKEIGIFRTLHHANIIRYLGIDSDLPSGDSPLPIVRVFMEYASGGTVATLLKRFGPLPEPVVGSLAKQLVSAIAYLHSVGVAHRDVKGANLLLTADGVAKLADFGSCKLVPRADSQEALGTTPAHGTATDDEEGGQAAAAAPPDVDPFSGLFSRVPAAPLGAGPESLPPPPPTASPRAQGTVQWMAPEVVAGAIDGSKWRAADVWSMGCTVVEMASGRALWDETNTTTLMIKIANEDAVARARKRLRGKLSEDGLDFVSRCLGKDPSTRPSAAELVQHPFLRKAVLPPSLPLHAAGANASLAPPRSRRGLDLQSPTGVTTPSFGAVAAGTPGGRLRADSVPGTPSHRRSDTAASSYAQPPPVPGSSMVAGALTGSFSAAAGGSSHQASRASSAAAASRSTLAILDRGWDSGMSSGEETDDGSAAEGGGSRTKRLGRLKRLGGSNKHLTPARRMSTRLTGLRSHLALIAAGQAAASVDKPLLAPYLCSLEARVRAAQYSLLHTAISRFAARWTGVPRYLRGTMLPLAEFNSSRGAVPYDALTLGEPEAAGAQEAEEAALDEESKAASAVSCEHATAAPLSVMEANTAIQKCARHLTAAERALQTVVWALRDLWPYWEDDALDSGGMELTADSAAMDSFFYHSTEQEGGAFSALRLRYHFYAPPALPSPPQLIGHLTQVKAISDHATTVDWTRRGGNLSGKEGGANSVADLVSLVADLRASAMPLRRLMGHRSTAVAWSGAELRDIAEDVEEATHQQTSVGRSSSSSDGVWTASPTRLRRSGLMLVWLRRARARIACRDEQHEAAWRAAEARRRGRDPDAAAEADAAATGRAHFAVQSSLPSIAPSAGPQHEGDAGTGSGPDESVAVAAGEDAGAGTSAAAGGGERRAADEGESEGEGEGEDEGEGEGEEEGELEPACVGADEAFLGAVRHAPLPAGIGVVDDVEADQRLERVRRRSRRAAVAALGGAEPAEPCALDEAGASNLDALFPLDDKGFTVLWVVHRHACALLAALGATQATMQGLRVALRVLLLPRARGGRQHQTLQFPSSTLTEAARWAPEMVASLVPRVLSLCRCAHVLRRGWSGGRDSHEGAGDPDGALEPIELGESFWVSLLCAAPLPLLRASQGRRVARALMSGARAVTAAFAGEGNASREDRQHGADQLPNWQYEARPTPLEAAPSPAHTAPLASGGVEESPLSARADSPSKDLGESMDDWLAMSADGDGLEGSLDSESAGPGGLMGTGEQLIVRAIADYDAGGPTELSLEAGEDLSVLQKDESGWWEGENSAGQRGWFPSNYVQMRHELHTIAEVETPRSEGSLTSRSSFLDEPAPFIRHTSSYQEEPAAYRRHSGSYTDDPAPYKRHSGYVVGMRQKTGVVGPASFLTSAVAATDEAAAGAMHASALPNAD